MRLCQSCFGNSNLPFRFNPIRFPAADTMMNRGRDNRSATQATFFPPQSANATTTADALIEITDRCSRAFWFLMAKVCFRFQLPESPATPRLSPSVKVR
jgi:hypothetical protein